MGTTPRRWGWAATCVLAVIVCCAGSCTSCAGDPNLFNNDNVVDNATFIAEVHLEEATACTADCGSSYVWRYAIATTEAYIGTPPPMLVSAYANYPETDVLVAARRFSRNQTPRFMLLGNIMGPAGEEGATCGLPAAVPVMDGYSEAVLVFTEDGKGLCNLAEMFWLHTTYPEDGRKDGYTYEQRTVACGRQRPTEDVLAAIERSRQRRPTRPPFSSDGSERVCHHPAGWDGGQIVGGDG